MKNILLLDTSVGSQNKGDDIIMECTREELGYLLTNNFEYTLPTHVSPFHWYQLLIVDIIKQPGRIQTYADCALKFIGGSNILCKNMLNYYPQWNINYFNCKPIKGSIGVGVGAGSGEKTNWYTRKMYQRVLSHDYYHSARDERTKEYIESLGLKAINTGCVTMWKLTPDFCKTIPTTKARNAVFTLTAGTNLMKEDQFLIDTLNEKYETVYFWPQGMFDFDYFKSLNNTQIIKILPANKAAYDHFLSENDVDYVGMRLHGGIYAMRHARRAIIISIDERASEINKANHLNSIDINNIHQLPEYIDSEFETQVVMDYDAINQWKSQFDGFIANEH